MREAARHASALTIQSQHLARLEASIESGKVALLDRMTGFTSHMVTNETTKQQLFSSSHTKAKMLLRKGSKGDKSRKFRLTLSRWLVGCVWEFGVQRNEGVWNIQIKPINVRPAHTYVFDFVREGHVMAVRELMKSRELSVHDCEAGSKGPFTLLEVSNVHWMIS